MVIIEMKNIIIKLKNFMEKVNSRLCMAVEKFKKFEVQSNREALEQH